MRCHLKWLGPVWTMVRLGAAVLQVLLGEPETSSGLDDGEILTDVDLFLTKDGCIFFSRQLSGAVYF